MLLILVAVLVFGLGRWGLVWVGAGAYKRLEQQIARLERENDLAAQSAQEAFYSHDQDDSVYAGTVAQISKAGEGEVAIWSEAGLRRFRAAQDTVYFYYDVCQAYRNNPQQMRINDEVRRVSRDIAQWAEWVGPGDFIQVVVATSSPDGEGDILREAYVYSHPPFAPTQYEVVCAD